MTGSRAPHICDPRHLPLLLTVFLLSLSSVLQCVVGLRVSGIDVPRVVKAGLTVRLTCAYEHSPLRPDPIYSIKWYRGHEQFYEHLPSRSPPTKDYYFPGLNVDKSSSSGASVVLLNVSQATSGVFRCEVMGDKPTFETDSMDANMTVLEVPSWGPVLLGARDNEEVATGHILSISCSIALTTPSATLGWLINGQPAAAYGVPSPVVQTYKNTHRPEIRSEMRLYLSKAVFRRGVVKLMCRAELEDVFLRDSHITLHDIHKPKPAVFGWFSSGCEARSYLLVTSLCVSATLLLAL